ncbi:unnamed protein product [Rhizophagus irregularis]|nr:unnamed protein product [Rhizophagus irregularis]
MPKQRYSFWSEFEEIIDSNGKKRYKCIYCNSDWAKNATRLQKHLNTCLARKITMESIVSEPEPTVNQTNKRKQTTVGPLFKLKQHRSAISDDVKHQICEWSTANKSKRHEERLPNTSMKTQTFRHKEVKFPALEHAMSLWVENVTAGGVILTDLLIKEKAKIFAEAFNIQEEDLSFSNGPFLSVNATGTDKLNLWLIGNSKRPRPLSKVNLNRLPVHYRGNPKAWMNSSVFEEVLREIDGYFRVQDKKILLLVDNAPSHFNPHYTPDLEIEQNDYSDDESSNENQSSRGRGGCMDGSRGRGSCMGRSRGRGSRSRGRGGRSRRDGSDRHHSDTSRLQLTHVERKFCRHMLDLFEDGKDINREKINIKEAIDYVAEAWDCVTEEAVQNCWKKTGILPSLSDEDRDNASRIQQEMMDNETADVNQMIEELDMNDDSAASLANTLSNFFQELEEIQTEDILNDADIIRSVQEDTCNESSDSEDDDILVSPSDALKSLETWISFFGQQDNDEFWVEDLKLFKRYFNIIKRLEQQFRKQASIMDYFFSI